MLQILEIIALEVLSHGICPKHLNQQGHEDICAEAIMLKKKKKGGKQNTLSFNKDLLTKY